MRLLRGVRAVAIPFAMFVVAAALAGSPGGTSAAANIIQVNGYTFSPVSLTVTAGEPITWKTVEPAPADGEPPGPTYIHLIHEIEHKGNWQVRLVAEGDLDNPDRSGTWTLTPAQYQLCNVLEPGKKWRCNISCILHPTQMLGSVDFVLPAAATPKPTPTAAPTPTPKPSATATPRPSATAPPTATPTSPGGASASPVAASASPTASGTVEPSPSGTTPDESPSPAPSATEPSPAPSSTDTAVASGDVGAVTASPSVAPNAPGASGDSGASPALLIGGLVVLVAIGGVSAFGLMKLRARGN